MRVRDQFVEYKSEKYIPRTAKYTFKEKKYIYIHIYICMYVYNYLHVYIYIYGSASVVGCNLIPCSKLCILHVACMLACMRACMHSCMHACMHVRP